MDSSQHHDADTSTNRGGNADEVAVTMDDGDTEMMSLKSSAIQKPLSQIDAVIKEACDIVTEGRAGSPATGPTDHVLLDEVDVDYNPSGARQQPIEVVVRHTTVLERSTRADSDSSDDDTSTRRQRLRQLGGDSSSRNKSKGVRLLGKNHGDGKDALLQNSDKNPPKRVRISESDTGFRKGHRRAWSMPSGQGRGQTTVSVEREKPQKLADGVHKRNVLHYQNKRMPRTLDDGPMFGEDDDELEIEINEEEIVQHNEEPGGRGARTIIKRFWEARWKAQNFEFLPEWLQDNEYLRTGHRPPLPSFGSCFKSIFTLHTETGNIWTHMYGCVAFLGVALWFLFRPSSVVQWQEKVVFSAFFLGAFMCLGMSFAFHTVACHSEGIAGLFSKLDYTGISLLIVGSFVPFIFYGFHCRPQPMIIYLAMIIFLGIAAIVVSLWDAFAAPRFRPLRAGVFIAMGLSSIVPVIHLLIVDGIHRLIDEASFFWLVFMGALYISGAVIYATRIPERFFPGKFDIWFQSHQLFHVFVIIAAFVHLHGICRVAVVRLEQGSCPERLLERYGSETNPSFLGTLFGLDESADVVSWNASMLKW